MQAVRTAVLAFVVLAWPCAGLAEDAAPPDLFRSCRMVFVGLLPNGAATRALDPAFAGGDLKPLETRAGDLLRAVPGWNFLKADEVFHGDEATEGNVIFVALVVSRAEVTHTAYRAIGAYRHTAWLTWSLEFFNVRTRSIYFSAMRTGYKSLQDEKPDLDAAGRARLLGAAFDEMLPGLVQDAGRDFDPDFVTGKVQGSGAKVVLALGRPVAVGPGQNFHTLGAGCTRDGKAADACALRVGAVAGGKLTLEVPPGTKVADGTRVFTIGNRKDPPGTRAFMIQKFVSDEKAGPLVDDGQFLMLQLHGRLAASGKLRMVPPLEISSSAANLQKYAP